MLTVTFHKPQEIDDSLLKYAVIAARYQGRWLFSRHKTRTTWEIPGGHRESGEKMEDTARRELWEETGAADADVRPVCV
jgi:8-oxo-dGTP diphosphatase